MDVSPDYYLTLKEKKRPELILSSRDKTPIAKVTGDAALHVFNRIVENPSVWEGLESMSAEGDTRVYSLRPDLAPIVASYILINRRSPKPSKWDWYLKEVLDGQLSRAGKNVSSIVELVFILRNSLGESSQYKSMDIVAGVLREFAKRFEKSVQKAKE
jgi:hypothetical protein